MLEFFSCAESLLRKVSSTQATAISEAAHAIALSLLAGGVWHVFGTGHSHVIAEELYFRAGGLAPVNAILYPSLMQHEGPVSSSRLERTPGLAKTILDAQDIRPGEVLTIVSNSGRNAVPVEMAILAREKGLTTVAITSLAQSKAAPLGQGQTRKLYEVCDLVIDNGGNAGDAALEVPNAGVWVSATSTLVGVAIVEQIVFEVACLFQEHGVDPPVFKSANLPGGDEWNQRLIERYGERVNLR